MLCLALGCTGTIDGQSGPAPAEPLGGSSFGGTSNPAPGAAGTSLGAGGLPGSPGGGAAAGGTSAGGTPGNAGAPTNAGAPPTTCTETVAPAGLVLLPDFQFATAVRSLLGDAAVSDQAPDASEKSFTQKGLVVTTSLVDTRLNWAGIAAASVGARLLEITGCTENGDDACAETFLKSFAPKAFRRPVAADELADLLSVYAVGKATSFRRGIELSVQAILGSPSFGYRTEFGVAAAPGRVTLTPHELASELSFFLTDGGPDAELLAAADANTLSTPAEIRQQVTRLLQTPRAQTSLTETLMSAWGIANLFGAQKPNFPEYTPLLQSSMYRETELFLHDVFWTTQSPVSLALTSSKTFVNEPLAKFYGVPYPGASGSTEFLPVTLPATERAGLLTQPSLLAGRARTDNTSVVARGLFVRGALLCLSKIASPPAALAERIQQQLAADLTERERSAQRTSDTNCRGCHAQFDAFGLLLENYDPIGRYRTQLNGQTIDATVDLNGIGSFTTPFASAVEFAKAAAAAPEFEGCLVQQMLAYGTGDERFSQASCEVREALQRLPSSEPTLGQIVAEVAASPALLTRSTEVTP